HLVPHPLPLHDALPISNPIYDLTATGRLVVALIGVITLLIGAIIGCAYDDIKKVLAYSTVSQIGYMILAVGLGPAGYALGIFHRSEEHTSELQSRENLV